MTFARRRALPFVIIAALFIAVMAFVWFEAVRGPSPAAKKHHTLLLLTSLPLVFNEDFTLSGSGSPVLKKLQSRYRVLPISAADDAELDKGNLLLMAQPPTQTADNLVALDRWVRGGGHVLLLADPLLEWPSKRPLGDPLRPPAVFMDTGLLAHWGLRLDAPDQRGPAVRELGGYQVTARSPGSLSGTCAISGDRLVAHCRLGRGSATVVADADLLDVQEHGVGTEHNLSGLLAELARFAGS